MVSVSFSSSSVFSSFSPFPNMSSISLFNSSSERSASLPSASKRASSSLRFWISSSLNFCSSSFLISSCFFCSSSFFISSCFFCSSCFFLSSSVISVLAEPLSSLPLGETLSGGCLLFIFIAQLDKRDEFIKVKFIRIERFVLPSL
ncbi:MAG: hypothetical protein BWX46_00531 [Candidatus Cloacimonetes bacterium ADurb.Bin003]|nr:MAG: hypothetical protein BWX46_00531 [Candidatus Cloacimonetes bacterium ADurb.Bin003]